MKQLSKEEMVEMIIRHSYTECLRGFSAIETRGYFNKLSDNEIFHEKMYYKENLARKTAGKILRYLSKLNKEKK
jgi:hypothetical protein